MRAIPTPALWLGLSGLIPFAALALAAHLAPAPWDGRAVGWLAGYGATILAFMGGCRWGFAAAGLGAGPGWAALGVAVLPSLWGSLALAAPHPWSLAMLATGLAALYLGDVVLTVRGGAPAWWGALRRPLTLGACAALAVGMAA